ncbi:recombinase family protein [Corynebacterium variabile]|uniref:recombinase family protein n=1 Tax=Corynebacterium variabile TaxID=1727 RepID=UPI003FCF62C2
MASNNPGNGDTPARPLRAALYARISLDLKEGAGVARQLDTCRDLAKLRGYEVVDEFVDNGRSAYTGKERPAYNLLTAGLREGRFDRVLVWHVDRLSRRTVDTLELLNLLKETGAKVEAVSGNGLDPSSSDGELLATILAAISSAESRHKGERVRAAQEAAARAGKPRRGGARTFGYEHGMMTVRENEAKWVREACRRVLAGESVRSICVDMEDAGVKTTRGHVMTTGVLRTLLVNPKIAALATWNPRRADGRLVKADRQIVGKGQWPALVDEDTWRAVEAILTDPSRQNGKRGNHPAHLGSGLYRCQCGRPMYVNQRKTRRGDREKFYVCKGDSTDGTSNRRGTGHTTRKRDPLDAYVTETLLTRLERDDLAELLARSAGAPDKVAELTRRRDELRQRLAALDEQVAAGGLSVDRYAAVAPKVEANIAAVTDDLAHLAHDESGVLSSVRDAGLDVRSWWETAPLDLQRALLDALMTVTLLRPGPGGNQPFNPDFVRIEWKV